MKRKMNRVSESVRCRARDCWNYCTLCSVPSARTAPNMRGGPLFVPRMIRIEGIAASTSIEPNRWMHARRQLIKKSEKKGKQNCRLKLDGVRCFPIGMRSSPEFYCSSQSPNCQWVPVSAWVCGERFSDSRNCNSSCSLPLAIGHHLHQLWSISRPPPPTTSSSFSLIARIFIPWNARIHNGNSTQKPMFIHC